MEIKLKASLFLIEQDPHPPTVGSEREVSSRVKAIETGFQALPQR